MQIFLYDHIIIALKVGPCCKTSLDEIEIRVMLECANLRLSCPAIESALSQLYSIALDIHEFGLYALHAGIKVETFQKGRAPCGVVATTQILIQKNPRIICAPRHGNCDHHSTATTSLLLADAFPST